MHESSFKIKKWVAMERQHTIFISCNTKSIVFPVFKKNGGSAILKEKHGKRSQIHYLSLLF